MKKLFVLTVLFALVLTTCDQPTGNSSKITLTIRNQSSYDLSDVKFSGLTFAIPGSSDELPKLTEASVQVEADFSKTGYVNFVVRKAGFDIECRTMPEFDDRNTFTITDSTVVEEIGNTNNRKSLREITYLSTVVIEHEGRDVAKNDIIDLGEAVVDTTKQNEFTIKNTGVGRLILSGNNPVKVEGDGNVFTVVQPSGSEIAPNGSLAFKINFIPINNQPYTATVTISSNDQNGDFTFTITATGVPPKPIVSVFYEDDEIPQDGTISVGDVVITQSKNITLVIKNTGTMPLIVSAADISITGTDASVFSKATSPGVSIQPDNQTSFIIKYEPVNQGENNAVLTIPTNDDSRNPVVVHLQGMAVRGSAVPELTQGTTFISNNSLTPFDFGQVELGTNITRIFTIKNTGNIALTLIGDIESSNSVFTVFTQPVNKTINSGAEESFIVRYTPTAELENTGTITITYNNNAQFVLNIKGTGHERKPQITVKQNNTIIDQHGEYNFGRVAIGEPMDISFTIGNSGDANLNFVTVNNNRINLADNDAGFFSVTMQPSGNTVVTPESTTTFTVRFNPTSVGNNFTATVQIKTNSRNHDEFYFTVKGNGYEKKSQIVIQQGITSIAQHGNYNFGTIASGKTSDITFTIGNSGDANLNFVTVADNRINLADNDTGFFGVLIQPSQNTVVAPEGTTTFTVRFSPTSVGNNYTAIVQIKTDSLENDEFSFTLTGSARAANSEARLSGIQFTTGTLVPQFNANIYTYDLRIEAGATLVNVLPTSMDSNITTIKVNDVSQSSGVQSQDIILASTNTIDVEVIAENGTSTATYTFIIKIIKTWEKLYGQAGRRYGVYRAISNGSGGVYAGGYTSNNTAALFNFDQNGNLQDTFMFSAYDNNVGITGLGMAYNDYYAVYWDYDIGDYYITRTSNPAVSPNRTWISLNYNDQELRMYPLGIVKDGWFYVAGNAHYAATANATDYTFGVFINRHYNDGSWEKGTAFSINSTGIKANTFEVGGMALLSNGDVLLYGQAETTAGRTVAFACAVNISAANASSWAVRWTNTYEITNKTSYFINHFLDNSSNIVLLGGTDDGGFIVKFPLSVTTAANAKPSGWPKVIAGTNGNFAGGLAVNDGSGYLLVGERGGGPYGGLDVWVVKTDTNANKTWEQLFGGTGNEWGQGIVEQSDGFIITGGTLSPVIAGQTRTGTEDIYIFKINKDGTMD